MLCTYLPTVCLCHFQPEASTWTTTTTPGHTSISFVVLCLLTNPTTFTVASGVTQNLLCRKLFTEALHSTFSWGWGSFLGWVVELTATRRKSAHNSFPRHDKRCQTISDTEPNTSDGILNVPKNYPNVHRTAKTVQCLAVLITCHIWSKHILAYSAHRLCTCTPP